MTTYFLTFVAGVLTGLLVTPLVIRVILFLFVRKTIR